MLTSKFRRWQGEPSRDGDGSFRRNSPGRRSATEASARSHRHHHFHGTTSPRQQCRRLLRDASAPKLRPEPDDEHRGAGARQERRIAGVVM